uniref:F-box protein At3g26010-like beta-propeller domain-containing protein n=1 Tax=Oryza meridionalis TaxID=40149 RepID=A0A0E0EWB0_9ORYZ
MSKKMAGNGKRKARSPPAMDATAELDDRLLAVILLRLPSAAALARAATVCRRWRRVASSPTFLRLDRMSIPRNFVVANPVSGRSVLVRDARFYQLDAESAYLGAALRIDDDNDGGVLCFEIIVVTYFMPGPRLCVFSSRSGAWTVHPYSDAGTAIMPMLGAFSDDMHTNGSVYWLIDDDDDDDDNPYLLALDARTKQFSNIKLPRAMRTRYRGNMCVMRSDDGELRVVAFAAAALDFWHLDKSRSSRGRWVQESRLDLVRAHGAPLFFADADGYPTRIMDAGEGFVFLKHYGSGWVFALSLETMMFIDLPHRRFYSGPALPYRMALHPPLPALAD